MDAHDHASRSERISYFEFAKANDRNLQSIFRFKQTCKDGRVEAWDEGQIRSSMNGYKNKSCGHQLSRKSK